MIKVAIVSSIRPETNYSAYLIKALQKNCADRVLVYSYCENEKENEAIDLENKRYCWDRNWRYFFQVLSQARQGGVNLLHFQHEINMFGGPRTAVIFPFLVLASRILGFKPIVTVHAVVPRKEFNRTFLEVFEWPKPILTLPLVKIVFPVIYFLIGLFAKKIIVHSPGLRDLLVTDYSFNSQKIEVIPHGIPEAISYPLSEVSRQLLDRLGDKKLLLYFGYLHRRKGLEVLIRALAKVVKDFPDLRLVLGGGTVMPGYLRELEELIRRLKINDRVLVTGFLKLTDLRYLIDGCHFVVLPAIYSIAASGPLAQVWAQGKAVIVSDLGVYHEEIRDRVNGLLAKVGDVDDLAGRMKELLIDETLRASIQKEVLRIREERDWRKISEKTVQIYQSLTK